MNTVFQVLTLAWSLQGGQYFGNAINDAGIFTTNDNYFIQTTFEFQVPLSWTKGDTNNFFIGADTENQFFHTAGLTSFSPWQDTFTFHSGVRFMGIEIGYQHQCVHPIVFSQNENTSHILAGYDKIYAKVSGSF